MPLKIHDLFRGVDFWCAKSFAPKDASLGAPKAGSGALVYDLFPRPNDGSGRPNDGVIPSLLKVRAQPITAMDVRKPTTNFSWLFMGFAWPTMPHIDLGSPK